MPLYINTNIASLGAQRNLSQSTQRLTSAFTRLSSGSRINSARDDAAGMGISESLRARIRSFAVAERNTNSAIGMLHTQETALGQMGDIVVRMRELAVQSANGALQHGDRELIQREYESMKAEMSRLRDSARYNDQLLLAGTDTTISFQVGIDATTNDHIDYVVGDGNIMPFAELIGTMVQDPHMSQMAMRAADDMLSEISARRASAGANINRFERARDNTQTMRTNLEAANSVIRDADIASEAALLARSQVLTRAGLSVLMQANQTPQLALSLL